MSSAAGPDIPCLEGIPDYDVTWAWRDGKLYVANHDAVLEFDYEEGATALTGP